MKKFKYTCSILCCALAILLLGACQKTEFMPDPEGVQVPFENNATKTVDELLTASSAKIFLSAWQKSNIKTILKTKGNKLAFTVFAPSDAAMQAAGLTTAAIAQLPVNELDSLVLFYTSLGAVAKETVASRTESTMVQSLLSREGLYVQYYVGDGTGQQQYDLYYYRHYLAIKADELLINGKSTGKVNYLPAKDGSVFLIEKVIERPYKTMLQALKDDGRFTIFVESQRIADELYIDKIASDLEPLFGYKPEPEEVMMSYAYQRKYYQNGWGINTPLYPGFVGPNINMSTLFAPTDEAFHKAGFQTLADVLKFNERGEPVRFDDTTFEAVGAFPMDSIYTYHRDWGRMFATKDPSYGVAPNNATVFYGNDLQPNLLNNYLVNIGGSTNSKYAFKMPLEFSVSGTTVQLKVKGSEYAPVNIVGTDINTLNGPIHVVDQLILPKGFKLK